MAPSAAPLAALSLLLCARSFLALPAANTTTGDVYLDEVQHSCFRTRGPVECIKYRALKYVYQLAKPNPVAPVFPLTGTLRVVPLAGGQASSPGGRALLTEASPRAGDSELDKAFRFALRRVEGFAKSRALVMDLPPEEAAASEEEAEEEPFAPKLIDAEGRIVSPPASESRGKKKKLAILLPLALFFKLKAIMIPILLGVLMIKKMLVVAAVLLPSLLSLVKVCKPPPQQHHHAGYTLHSGGWASGPDGAATDYGASYGYGPGATYYDASRRQSGHQLSYRAYAPQGSSSPSSSS